MDLFGFAKDVGRRVFGKESEADQKIREMLEADNPGIQDLDVKVENGRVAISGKAADAAAMEKAVLMVGNVQGIEAVDASAVAAPKSVEEVEFYLIESGDTLSKVAQRFYGDANAYPKIFEANREVIKDPDLIFVGQKIRIPRQTA
ncbi:peptidoglycan-binding protein LysM [Thiorhodovibrio frisius]|uniref:Potassium binding protein Kbp n=1 Tax=Thiorhodovibrio frisius TaxID=631362 RepID=H8Z4G4_9GAMM|nr:peptidoglycan-binding protein LysM [Thiorhodovibrio frisius]EIC20221.1 putative phospholipid-binding protein,LysM domain-containing protein [Thiorhodovibrio frisius]WPL20959.1 LysM domain/BON superfamily protein [Thiorhodovibrio frisius]